MTSYTITARANVSAWKAAAQSMHLLRFVQQHLVKYADLYRGDFFLRELGLRTESGAWLANGEMATEAVVTVQIEASVSNVQMAAVQEYLGQRVSRTFHDQCGSVVVEQLGNGRAPVACK